MPRLRAALDHVVINTRDELAMAAGVFSRLGFQLTPRGEHSVGSSNHLAVFGTSYLELIGAPRHECPRRSEFFHAPAGLFGYAFAAVDAESVHAHLLRRNVPCTAPLAISRPVNLGAADHLAKFRTVRFDESVFHVGRVFFCEHSTKELVWHAEWMKHANGVTDVARTVWVAADKQRVATTLSDLFEIPRPLAKSGEVRVQLENSRLSVMDQEAFVRCYGDAAALGDSMIGYMGAVQFEVQSLQKVVDVLRSNAIPLHRGTDRVIVPASVAMNTTIEFILRPE
jgi:hypothetical protein